MAMEHFGLFGKLVAAEGRRDELAGHLLEAAQMLGDAQGCKIYLVNISADDANAIWVTEVWKTEADHAASLQRADVRALIAKARPLIAGGGDRFKLTVLGGKGLEG